MKIPFWGTILTIMSLMILCALGSWQIDRLGWKEDLLARIAVEQAVDANTVDLSGVVLGEDMILKRGFLKGRYAHDKAILIRPRTFDGASGYHVFTPFEVSGGSAPILVNRGWIPIERDRGEGHVMTQPTQEIVITGILKPVPKVNMFVSKNAPDKDAWYRIDLEQIARAKGVSHLSDSLFYVEQELAGGGVDSYPIPAASHIALNNNHLQYALFWFFLAVMMVVVYVFRFIVPQLRPKDI